MRPNNETLIYTRNRPRRDDPVVDQKGPCQATGSMTDSLANACEKGYSFTCLRPACSERPTESRSGGHQALIFREEFAVGRRGWWKRQMLVDRSLRLMAALTTIFAVILVLICAVYFRRFLQRRNRHSTSVGAETGERCDILETQTTVRLCGSFTTYSQSLI